MPVAVADRKRITDALATVLGVGMFAAGIAALVSNWPMGTALMLLITGGALLPVVRFRSQTVRIIVIVAAFGVAMATPLYSDFEDHREVQAAYRAAMDAIARLTAITKDGRWPTSSADFPDQLEPVYSDGYSRDLKIKDCRGASCTLVVTLTDHDYATSIRSRSFALWTNDGGKTWNCGPTKLYPLAPKDLPTACESTGAH